ncbi:uncharacterized protein ACO6RY_16909 [Pungitius sinensis]
MTYVCFPLRFPWGRHCHPPPPTAIPLASRMPQQTKTPVEQSYDPLLHCQAKPSFYGRRSSNCLSLVMLSDQQFLEFLL